MPHHSAATKSLRMETTLNVLLIPDNPADA